MENILKKSAQTLLIIYIIGMYSLDYTFLNSFFDLLILASSVLAIFYGLLTRKLKDLKIFVPRLIFVIFVYFSILWSLDKMEATKFAFTILQMLTIYIATIFTIDTEKDIKIYITTIILSGFFMILYSLIYYGPIFVINSFFNGTRLGTGINHINSFGLYNSITFSLLIYMSLIKKRRVLFILSLIPLAFALSSGSRKVLLMLIITFVFSIYYLYKNKKYVHVLSLITIVIVALLAGSIFLSENILISRIFSLSSLFGSGEIDVSLSTRLNMITFGISTFRDNFLIGLGANQYRFYYLDQFGFLAYSHNNYIEVIVNFGIIGFIIYYMPTIKAFYREIKNKRKNTQTLLILLLIAIVLIDDLTTVSIYNKYSHLFLAVIFAYSYHLRRFPD